MTIRTKLIGSFALVAIICATVGTISLVSNHFYSEVSEQVADCNGKIADLNQRKVEHLSWINQTQDLFLHNQKTLTVEVDHTKCALGQFLYGPEFKEIQSHDPELAQTIEAIIIPHQELHSSAGSIKQVWQQRHDGLEAQLSARKDDHRRRIQQLIEAIAVDAAMTGSSSASSCQLGIWLDSRESTDLVAESTEYADLIGNLKKWHDDLHAAISKVQSQETPESRVGVYRNEVKPALQMVINDLESLIETEHSILDRQDQAEEIYSSRTLPALDQVQEAIAGTTDFLTNRKSDLAKQEARAKTLQARASWIGMILGTILAFALGISSAQSIIKRVNQTARLAAQISTGDLSQRLRITHKDEIGAMARSMDEMAETLK